MHGSLKKSIVITKSMVYGTRRLSAAFTSAPLSRVNLVPRIDYYFFKIHYNIVSYLRLSLPKFSFL